jgi:hypothetical protein
MASGNNIPQRRSRSQRNEYDTSADVAVGVPVRSRVADTRDDDDFFSTRMPKSAVRYRNTQGHEVIQKGKQRLVIHHVPPPVQRHWLVPAGLGMLAIVLLLISANWINGAWQQHQLDVQYGMPRTYQTDAVVGHDGDSEVNPSHFTFMNLHCKVTIIEIPAGDVSKSLIYAGPTLFGPDCAGVPITGAFQDVGGDGKPDMIVRFSNETVTYLNDGSKFVAK